MSRSDRLLAIVLALQTHQWQTANDLAAMFAVSSRTIYRDMEMLMKAGVPVVAVPGKGYRLNEGFFLPPVTFTTDEAMLLLLGADAVSERLGMNYQVAAQAARTKLEAVLPDRLRSEVAALQTRMRFVPVNAFDRPEEQAALETLRRAMKQQRSVQFFVTPRSSGDGVPAAETHTFDPYGLLHVGSGWHVVGWHHEEARVRHFRLTKLHTLSLTDQTYERPAGYAASSTTPPLDTGDVTVRVHFSPTVARWVREAPSFFIVDMETRPDGLLVTLHVHRETEVLPWLLSWGAHAHVLEPASLQRRLAHEAERMAERYAATAPSLLS